MNWESYHGDEIDYYIEREDENDDGYRQETEEERYKHEHSSQETNGGND